MRIRRLFLAELQGRRTLDRKVQLAKIKTSMDKQCRGLVFVVDTEGLRHDLLLKQLQAGRDSTLTEMPTAVGAAHPCLEAWILANPSAIRKGMNIEATIETPSAPEELAVRSKDQKNSPKRILADLVGVKKDDLSVANKTKIVREIQSLDDLHNRCPVSFSPFFDEISDHIKPLFAICDGGESGIKLEVHCRFFINA